MIRVQKIEPLNKFTATYIGDIDTEIDTESVQRDIHCVLDFLHEHRLSQGDVRLDNIGQHDGKYVLFDYDGACLDITLSEMDRDLDIFTESICRYKAHPTRVTPAPRHY